MYNNDSTISWVLDMLLFGLLISTNFKMGSRKRESVCVCVCVRERGGGQRERERERKREYVLV